MLFMASDHAGFELKAKIYEQYSKKILIEDLGTTSTESCDYPDFAFLMGERIVRNPGSLGLLICGTGIGMAIAANKVSGVRAASVSEAFSARMAREHNDANILCLGARVLDFAKACECLDAFMGASFDTSNPRHQKRVDKISDFEKNQP